MSGSLFDEEPIMDVGWESQVARDARLRRETAARVTAPMPGAARFEDPVTSHRAARNVAVRSGTQRHKVLATFGAHPEGLTGDALAELLGDVNASSWRSRMAELRDRDLFDPPLVERTGETRRTRSGEDGDVHVITAAGRTALADLD